MALGWGQFFGALGKLIDIIPFQKKKERWKNELDNLTKERAKLISGKATDRAAKRIIEIDNKIADLHQKIKNSTED